MLSRLHLINSGQRLQGYVPHQLKLLFSVGCNPVGFLTRQTKQTKNNNQIPAANPQSTIWYKLMTSCLASAAFLTQFGINQRTLAQSPTNAYCHFNQAAVTTKDRLLRASLQGDVKAQQQYEEILKQHGTILRQCRSRNWPQTQAIWLRLYPCDIRSGMIDYVLDRIVNLGYNQIHLEVLFDSQVLLPPADNPTPWTSVVRTPGAENVDLLDITIKKGRKRGLKVYAWLFTMNFGYTYAQRPDRQDALARNGKGEDSLSFVHDGSQAFIDPYSRQAQIDYYNLVRAVLKRKPDGVLYDYIRYPRGTGSRSVASRPQDLWIYGKSSQTALYDRALNNKAKELIKRYLAKGKIHLNDVIAVDQLYPQEGAALWQGRQVNGNEIKASVANRHQKLQSELWFLVVAHAAQGVIDFLSFAAKPVQRQGLPVGAVFFPDANRSVGRGGFDSRLQAWDRFPSSLQWHPMAYSVCNGTQCIVDEVKEVLAKAPPGTKVIPALAGVWGKVYQKHPPIEAQLHALRRSVPQIKAISHFAYSWQEPSIDRQRRFCKF